MRVVKLAHEALMCLDGRAGRFSLLAVRKLLHRSEQKRGARKFQLVDQTAKALGLSIPPAFVQNSN